MTFIPQEDGITHINVYSKGRTALGLFLSNFTTFPLETEDGNFESVEGYWYWLSVSPDEPRRDELRRLSGFDAKKLGRELRGKTIDIWETPEFQEKIKKAIRYKVFTSSFRSVFAVSTLPLTHYYVFADGKVHMAGGKWIIDYLEQLRTELKNG